MTLGTFVIGACVLLPSAPALSGERIWKPADGLPITKAESTLAERLLTVGTTVLAVDGTVVGTVSSLSRNSSGHVERIRVASSIGAKQTILIIRDAYFSVTGQAVRLKLTIAELDAMPRAMMEDKAAGSPRNF
jgi:hypothetical protein